MKGGPYLIPASKEFLLQGKCTCVAGIQLDTEERGNMDWETVSKSWGFGDQQMYSCICDFLKDLQVTGMQT